jgi:hypothetical protein
MGTHALTDCPTRAACRAQRPRRRHGAVARITALALALGALVLVFSGEHFVLAEAPATANELNLATCALDDVYDVRPAGVCINPNAIHEQGHTL